MSSICTRGLICSTPSAARPAGRCSSNSPRPGCPAAFIPNPVDSSVERYQAFREHDPAYDLVFFGRDKHAPQRRGFLEQLLRALPDLRAGIFGSLGRPLVFGAEKEVVLANSRMGLNLSRRNDVELYSSDRIAQLTGNGLLALIQRGGGLEQLYSEDEVVFYEDLDDLVRRIPELLAEEQRCRAMAENGWKRTHRDYSAQAVCRFVLHLTFGDPRVHEAPWSEHIFRHPSTEQSNHRHAA